MLHFFIGNDDFRYLALGF